MKTSEIKRQALEILNSTGSDVKLSDFTVKQARQVIKENEFIQNQKK